MRLEAAFVFARLAQLVRAPRLHRGCRGFESLSEHANNAEGTDNGTRKDQKIQQNKSSWTT
jgi:hypothetical protein